MRGFCKWMMVLLAGVLVVACQRGAENVATSEPDVAPGDLGCPCYGNGTCNTGLECASGVCVAPAVTVISAGVLGGPCDGSTTCNAGLECVEGLCAEPAPVVAVEIPDGFVRIEPGRFTMGAPEGELGREIDETQHEVTLTRAFLLQATEVTQGEYSVVSGTNRSRFTDCGSDCPAEQVSWYDAIAYANALSRAEGLPSCYSGSGDVVGGATVYDCVGYRLPTEAEWEYAARAGTVRATYAGDLTDAECEDTTLLAIAWFCGNRNEATTRPVGTKAPNAWGLYDMLGNVAEWTHDRKGPYGGDATDPSGPVSGTNRVLRGGDWNSSAQFARAADRDSSWHDHRVYLIGFRLARSLR